MTIYGVDLSDFNAVTTAQVGKFRAAGISFLTHKSVETSPGGNVRHVKMKAVLEAAKAGGVPFLGAYMVPRTGLSAATQGQAHIAYLDAQVPWWRTHPGFFHQVDLEVWDYDAVAASVGNGVFDWLKANGAGKPVVLYASKGQYGASSMRTPRWNANYPGASVADFKAKYAAVGGDSGAGWTSYGNPAALPLLWQYCDNATVAGSPPIDCNAYRGTEAQFAAALGFGEVPTTPSTTPTKGLSMDRIAVVTDQSKPANDAARTAWYFGNGLRYRTIVTWPEHDSLVAGGAVEKAFNLTDDWQGYVGRIADAPASTGAPTVDVTQVQLNAAVAANVGAIAQALAAHFKVV